MRYALAALMVLAMAGCPSSTGTRDPIAVGRSLGALSCTIAVTERPEVKAPLAKALADVETVLRAPDPSVAAISAALSEISDPKVRAYAGGTVALVLALFPDLPANADAVLSDEVKDAILAAVSACQSIVGIVPTTTITSSTTTTTL